MSSAHANWQRGTRLKLKASQVHHYSNMRNEPVCIHDGSANTGVSQLKIGNRNLLHDQSRLDPQAIQTLHHSSGRSGKKRGGYRSIPQLNNLMTFALKDENAF